MFKFNKSNDSNQNERTIPNPQPWQNEQVSSVCTHCKFLSVSTKNKRQLRTEKSRSGLLQGRTYQQIIHYQGISPPNIHNTDWAGCTYTLRIMHVYTDTWYTYTHINVTKERVNLKEWGGLRESLEGGKEGKWYNYVRISKNKRHHLKKNNEYTSKYEVIYSTLFCFMSVLSILMNRFHYRDYI